MLYGTPLFVGGVLVFFMVKPLFARRGPRAQPLALNPGAEPAVFAFITQICRAVGAPFPTRIDVDCQLNASAGFRRGLLSFFGNDLVLTIGLPLVAGLTLRELAGVIAHEFGHFTQGFGMRLTYVIRTVNAWFGRVIYERDAWDLTLEEWTQTEDWRLAIVAGCARLAVWFSRLLLKLLMLLGHGISCFMLRQMEYDADSYEIKLVGSETFEATVRRFHLLGHALGQTYKDIRTKWNMNRALPNDFPTFLLGHYEQVPMATRTQLDDSLGFAKTGAFDTHPSDGDRIRCARQASEQGVFHLDSPATVLFGNFEVLSRQITLLHYSDDLGLPIETAIFQPVAKDAPVAPEPEKENSTQPAEQSANKPGLKLKLQGPS
jgi:Zn-dependent protease with chaperone function